MEMELLMPFLNDSEDFAYGFQCGQIWERLNHNDTIEGQYIHAAVKDQIEMICRRFHATYTIEPIFDGFYVLDAKIDIAKAN